jgi:hypothetical protein
MPFLSGKPSPLTPHPSPLTPSPSPHPSPLTANAYHTGFQNFGGVVSSQLGVYASQVLHPFPHPTPHTLHPTPYTLHPTP